MKKLLLVSALAVILTSCGSTTQYSNLTACLQKNQVVMFGASWCPHCASQKKLFGKSVKELPYFECSKNGEQVKECNDRAISSYPTWQFPEDVLKKLPETALVNLYNTELEKVRASIKWLKQALPAEQKEAIKALNEFEKKTEATVNSDIPVFEKLSKLTSLVVSEGNKVSEQAMYVSGRVSGERPLSEIALYSGCNAEYQADISVEK